jgi:hypothetical protein
VGTRDYEPFDKPEAVALGMANALILFARTIAEKDPSFALDSLEKVHCKLMIMLDGLNVSQNDRARVANLMTETEVMVSAFGVRH